MSRSTVFESGLRAPRSFSLKTFKLDFIDYDDKPDTVERVAKECLERPDFITGLPDMPRLSDEPRRRFLSAARR